MTRLAIDKRQETLARVDELLKSREVYEFVLDLMHEPKFRHLRCFEKLPYSHDFDKTMADIKEMRELLKYQMVRSHVCSTFFNNNTNSYVCNEKGEYFGVEYIMDSNSAYGWMEAGLRLRELSEEDVINASKKLSSNEGENPLLKLSASIPNLAMSDADAMRHMAEKQTKEYEAKQQTRQAVQSQPAPVQPQLVSVTPAQPQAQVVQKASEHKGIRGIVQKFFGRGSAENQ